MIYVIRGPGDLVLHDWRNMPPEERRQALADIRALAESHADEHRRARALHVIASFFHFLTEDTARGG
jgi:acyl-CoA reductase-like NAD-dependent aldehyde dehydrogenase